MTRKIHPAVVSAQPFQVANLRPTDRLFEDEEGRDRLEKAISRYPDKRAALLPMLAYAQERNGWVSPESMQQVAEALDLTPAYVNSVATFYTMYNKHPTGRHMIQVCTCVACHLCGGEEVFEAFLEATGTVPGAMSEDGKYVVMEAECLGACGFATAVQVNDRYFENVTPETVGEVLARLEQDGGE
ncbi:MAG: NAD(P)H-dependent oxidoreductase subunit E [Gemmatimonadota bacterium]|nr:NAD(P)H-dependent oxidoreductase subunit E [Gemmatimonadota bacterium]MDH3427198.1 NAD(P)H-dependent oxidoreductase subunit E [Gemmatimonadota bacterium]